MYKKIFKRFWDYWIAIMGLILISPVFITFTLLLLIANKGKPFFLQLRTGRNNKIFKIVKFKTMNDKQDKDCNLLPDAKRLTAVGQFLRKTSLDEIPQLLNVIKGDMSLVGPRPLLLEYLPLYNKEQARRNEVRPGITGWSQINGRNTISWQQKFEYDVWYIDNISFSLDIKILLHTVLKVVKKEGISSKTSATMEKFEGN